MPNGIRHDYAVIDPISLSKADLVHASKTSGASACMVTLLVTRKCPPGVICIYMYFVESDIHLGLLLHIYRTRHWSKSEFNLTVGITTHLMVISTVLTKYLGPSTCSHKRCHPR